MDTTLKAALYIRVSTEEQSDYSPTVQKEELLQYAKLHSIHVHDHHIYIDDGFSGKSAARRPAFSAMIREAKKKPKPFDFILVHKYDRFARNKEDSVLYKALLRKDCGISVISIKEPIPEDNKFAVIYESMLEAMAEYYSLNLAEEVKKTMTKKAHLGEYQAAAPFGYKNKNKTLVIQPEEANIVSFIFEQYLLYDKSFFEIARIINARGILTHRGNSMESRSIQYIICNPVYCGYCRWTPTGKIRRQFHHPDSILAKGTFPPIISEEIFLAAQNKYLSHKKKTSPIPSRKERHWLSGLVKCGCCGRSLTLTKSKTAGEFILQCSGYNHGLCAESHFLRSESFIPFVLETLKEILYYYDPSSVKIVAEKINDCFSKKQEMNAQLKKIDQKLKKASDAYYHGIDSLEEYKKNKAIFTEEKQKLQTLLSPSSSSKSEFPLETLVQTLQNSEITMETKRKAASAFIEKLIYHKDTHTLEFILKEKIIS